MKCPLCGYQRFYLKDADDEYETYGFDCASGEACFDPDIDASDAPELDGDAHIYCEQCAWNGRYDDIIGAWPERPP